MKILILGASNSQLNAILKAKQKGHTVIVSDYYEDAPGKAFSDYNEITSTFDIEGSIEIGHKYGIDGVLTLGTDQPVYTCACVAEKLDIPTPIDVKTAKAVTNKKVMKNTFVTNNIPTVEYRILKEDFSDGELECIKFPVVIKPLDSQGQRGVYKVDSVEEARNLFKDVLSYSRENEILLEEYYEGEEITVSGWVVNDETHIITVTDRVTYNNYPHIGICTAHNFPTKYHEKYFNEISIITKIIVKNFSIHNGPIYFQMLIGREGIKVNEIACRIGGAYEDEFIPMLTGIDILDMLIDSSIGREVDFSGLRKYNILENNNKASVQMIFLKPGVISHMNDMDEIRKLPGVVQAKYNFKTGTHVGEIVNATQRAGYMIIRGQNKQELIDNIRHAYDKLQVLDKDGSNMVLKF